MNYLVMDRASEAAANDLAEVRKLIEGMNALVYSQIQQQQALQQQAQQQQQQQQTHEQIPETQPQHKQDTIDYQVKDSNLMANNVAQPLQQPNDNKPDFEQAPSPSAPNLQEFTQESNTNTLPLPPPSPQQEQQLQQQQQQQAQMYSAPIPQAGVIVEVTHLTFNRVLYFQLTPEATIEPVVAWLRLSYQDAAISGMVLQYKGFDGLWKCLLNRDDSLRRILKQSMKGNTMLQMRVPRKQDLLSSGYTDTRLLALTETESMQ